MLGQANPEAINMFIFPLHVQGILHQIVMPTDTDMDQLNQLKQSGSRMEATYVPIPGAPTDHLLIRLPPSTPLGDTVFETAAENRDPLLMSGSGLARVDVAIEALEQAYPKLRSTVLTNQSQRAKQDIQQRVRRLRGSAQATLDLAKEDD